MMDMVAHVPTKWNVRPERLWLVGGVHEDSCGGAMSKTENTSRSYRTDAPVVKWVRCPPFDSAEIAVRSGGIGLSAVVRVHG